jgi:type IV pilus assembly protein PilM
LLEDPPPEMAIEVSEAGLAAARPEARAEVEFRPFKPGTLTASRLKENIIDGDDFAQAAKSLAGALTARKRKDLALILPDYSARVVVLDFDEFPSDAKEQMALVRFRLRRSVPFDVDAATVSYWAQPAGGHRRAVVAAVALSEIIMRYEAPFRAAGLNPGWVTPTSLAALELVPPNGLSALAKRSGRILAVLVAEDGALKLARCVEMASGGFEDAASVLVPTFAFVEDNLGRRPERLWLCGFGARTGEFAERFRDDLNVAAEQLVSPWGAPGENDAGLLGYLRSVRRPVPAGAGSA